MPFTAPAVDVAGHLSAGATREASGVEGGDREGGVSGQVHLDPGGPGPAAPPWQAVGVGSSHGTT